MDVAALATELERACAHGQTLAVPLSAREPGFDLDAAYRVEAELVRREQGHTTSGRKVGYANKALWRALKLETLVWAHMYDDTVTMVDGNAGTLPVGHMRAPRIEPEIVFRLRGPIDPRTADPAAVLPSVEWLALGFEIVDSVFANWMFQPADFVAAYGLHAALVVGDPHPIDALGIPVLLEHLRRQLRPDRTFTATS